MKYSIKILEETKNRLITRRQEIAQELDNDPLSVQLKCHGDFAKWLERYKGSKRGTEKARRELMDIGARKEEAERREKNYSRDKLTTELIQLDSEIQEISNQIYYLTR